MTKQTIDLAWKSGMTFETEISGHTLIVDADDAAGGSDLGPRPKPLMLVALAGCTGMDVISILKKMRVDVEGFAVKVEAEMTDEHPKVYSTMHVIYEFKGHNLPMDKLKKAVDLSEERYCGVSAVYRQAVKMSSDIRIID
ncbi:OsmC family protein [bacterium]|nr:OsmC family protein [bacterium]